MSDNEKISESNKATLDKIKKGNIKKNISKKLKVTKKKNYFLILLRFFLKFIFIILILLTSLAAGSAFALWSFSNKLPDVSKIEAYIPNETSEIYDSKGALLAKLHEEENRFLVPLNEIPIYARNAVIAMEDERFYSHIGIDFKAILRSAISMIDDRMVKGGGSTLTQQLAKNLFLSPERKITRKLAEWLLAIKIERNFTKSKILELYLNQVYWGHNSYGIEAASKTFFGKSAKDLKLSEASMIAGLLSSPEYYSPYRSMKLAKWRQSLVLGNMVKNGFINKKQADEAKKDKIVLKSTNFLKSYKFDHPYFTGYVVSLLKEKYGEEFIRKGGLKVYTTINPDYQKIAQDTLEAEIKKLKNRNITQGAIVSIDAKTGYIKALVGGVNYKSSQFNRVTQAKRQPGSSFKPFVYLSAFEKGIMTPLTKEVDEKITYPDLKGTWSPNNYNKRFRGKVTIKQAIQYSINTVAVKTLDKVGAGKVIETAKKLGIESYMAGNLSLALGTSEMTPLEMASAYTVFVNGGKKVRNITPIIRIEDSRGNILEENSNQGLTRIFDEEYIDMVNEGTLAVVNYGTGRAARLPGIDVAGKTGTTSDYRDAWFMGYTPEMVTAVWVGNDNNSKTVKATGGGVCAPIWSKYMKNVVKDHKQKRFVRSKEWYSEAIKEQKKKEEEENADIIIFEIDENDNIIQENIDESLMIDSDILEQNEIQDKPKLKPLTSKSKPANKVIEKKKIKPKKDDNGFIELDAVELEAIEVDPNKKSLDEEMNDAINSLESIKEIYDGGQ